MPPRRRRRAGSRPGTISAQLADAITAEADLLRAIDDPLKRVKAVNDLYAQLDFELEQIAAVRLDAVKELRAEGWSYTRLADATRLSRSRIQQLAQGAQAGGRQAKKRPD